MISGFLGLGSGLVPWDRWVESRGFKRREKEGSPAERFAGLPDRDTGACGVEFPEPGAKENGLLGDSPVRTGLRETETLFTRPPPQ